jgi:hypothetical protein
MRRELVHLFLSGTLEGYLGLAETLPLLEETRVGGEEGLVAGEGRVAVGGKTTE